MDEVRHYEETLNLILNEAKMFLGLKYGTPDLELRMKSASLLKIQLFAQNALTRFAPKLAEEQTKNES